ncbi:hypothetical protein LOK46_06060 [Methylobacterium sp. NMS14P]|uniref:hypothetical protein n=1 Tax=Methylobacterium sp. NMS14P TaxID=2894310 RepID=UPI0023583EB2|nr:hypothetical protein [Methylobacterium sp. NMS14P]WCS26397.1 hypothetical protein LOK46_06060 [Methylobacterium sp. NMS14P]
MEGSLRAVGIGTVAGKTQRAASAPPDPVRTSRSARAADARRLRRPRTPDTHRGRARGSKGRRPGRCPGRYGGKIEIRSLEEELNAFKIEVARTCVTGDVITRLERRIDDMVSSVRGEMKETCDEMLKAFMRRPSD